MALSEVRTEDLELDVNFEEARAIHRVVRGMHDGECPNCHRLFQSHEVHLKNGDMICPKCKFKISHKEAEKAIEVFSIVMERNLAVFENWRKSV